VKTLYRTAYVNNFQSFEREISIFKIMNTLG